MAFADRLARMKEYSASDATYIGLASAASYMGHMARFTNLSDAQTNIRTQISLGGDNPPDAALENLSIISKKS